MEFRNAVVAVTTALVWPDVVGWGMALVAKYPQNAAAVKAGTQASDVTFIIEYSLR
jgi:hypothetical protein